jgi:hypothetical protein
MLCCCLIELAREVSVDKYDLLLTGVLQVVHWFRDNFEIISSKFEQNDYAIMLTKTYIRSVEIL